MFPERLKTIRIDRGLTQAQLASILGVGRAAIAKWESGTREPRLQILVKLCDALDVSSDYLLGRTQHCTFPSVDNSIPEGQDNEVV